MAQDTPRDQDTDFVAIALATACQEFRQGRRADGDGGRKGAGMAVLALLDNFEAMRPDLEALTEPVHHLLSILDGLDEGKSDPLVRPAKRDGGAPSASGRHDIFKQVVAAATEILVSGDRQSPEKASADVLRRLRRLGWQSGTKSTARNWRDEMHRRAAKQPQTVSVYEAHIQQWHATADCISARAFVDGMLDPYLKAYF